MSWSKSAMGLFPSILLFMLMLFASQFPVPYLTINLPLLPALPAIYYWSLFRPASIPLLALAIFGLLHDVLYGLPLGCSLLLFLSTRLISSLMRKRIIFEQFAMVWIIFAPVMLVLWLLLALCQNWVEAIDITRILSAYDTSFFVTWCSYPLLHLLFNWCYHQLPARA